MTQHLLPAVCLAFALMLITFCAKVIERNSQVFGKWQGVEWTASDGSKLPDADMVQFQFSEDGNYIAQLGDGYSEVGIWRTEGEKLYTTATGRREKVVKIVKVDTQNLTFEMNRAGRTEILTLQKQ